MSSDLKRRIDMATDRVRILRIQNRYGLATLADVRRAEQVLAELRKAGERR
jgi:hypothetical protein